jgi:prepilin-type N-terminal cleavage/methylation domain-containing protein
MQLHRLPMPADSAPKRLSHGFSLIEFIGVLAILAILSAVIAPNLIRQIDMAERDAEVEALRTLESGLRQYVRREKSIPDAQAWANAVASQINRPVAQVRANKRGLARILAYDGQLAANLPFHQSSRGFPSRPDRLRFMLISHLRRDIEALHPGGDLDSMGTGTFDAVWNQQGQPEALTEGGDLLIQRIQLSDMFHILTLNNNDGVNAWFEVDGTGRVSIDAGASLHLALMHASQVRLLNAAVGGVAYTHTMTGDTGFSYLSGWGGRPGIKGG